MDEQKPYARWRATQLSYFNIARSLLLCRTADGAETHCGLRCETAAPQQVISFIGRLGERGVKKYYNHSTGAGVKL